MARPVFSVAIGSLTIFLLSLSRPTPIKTKIVILPPFAITISIADNSYTFQVVHVPVSGVVEHFRVIRGSNEWVLQSNRPLLHARGLKNKRPEIKWLSGDSWDRTLRARLSAAIAEKLTQ